MRVDEIAKHLQAGFEGAGDFEITSVAALESAGPSEIAFVGNRKAAAQAGESQAGCLLVTHDFPAGRTLIRVDDPRGDPTMTFPIVDFDHTDPLFSRLVAATGVYVYREKAIKALTGMLIFGDNPSGELFYVDADKLPGGGQNFHRILFNDKGDVKTLLQIIKDKNTQQGRMPANRADLRMGAGPNGRLFVLNKHDGIIRLLAP